MDCEPEPPLASPPTRPLIIYDGDCNFCVRWIHRWQATTGELVDYVPFQNARLAEEFPGLARERLETAVHLIDTDGRVYSGAEAAFRALAKRPGKRWLLDCYQRSPALARASEWAYRQIAGHRTFFSFLTRIGWGSQIEPASYELVRWVFLRSLGIIYLTAFISLWVQIPGLVGRDGILPAKLTMEAVQRQAADEHLGWDKYHLFPTLCWLNNSDGFLKSQCAAGTALAFLVIAGLAPAPCLFLLWVIYLSLATVCREFLGFQWDNLLLETGLLAIFFAPWQMLPRLNKSAPASRLVLWLIRWLLFRLMFASGCVKLLSGDPNWRNLSALNFHYETQPLPTWIGWYAHQLPFWAQKTSTVLMFAIELVLPFLILAPRRVRHIPCVVFIFFQILILLTGNYCFFNLLSILLCLVLVDDAALVKLIPSKWRERISLNYHPPAFNARWRRVVLAPFACVILFIPLLQFCGMFGLRSWPEPARAAYQWLQPFRSINSYGLFAVMTTSRPEIIVEGSEDGVTWHEYEFRYKAGDIMRRPRFVEPHQPRLDWQMWFAALGDYRQNPWFVNFCVRLLQNSPEVLALLKNNPFPKAPPRYIRAVVYEYHFTDMATRHQTGAWWRRERKGEYLPIISLRERPG